MLNTFEISRVLENVESWSVYADTVFWIVQPYFKTFNEKKKKNSFW